MPHVLVFHILVEHFDYVWRHLTYYIITYSGHQDNKISLWIHGLLTCLYSDAESWLKGSTLCSVFQLTPSSSFRSSEMFATLTIVTCRVSLWYVLSRTSVCEWVINSSSAKCINRKEIDNNRKKIFPGESLCWGTPFPPKNYTFGPLTDMKGNVELLFVNYKWMKYIYKF